MRPRLYLVTVLFVVVKGAADDSLFKRRNNQSFILFAVRWINLQHSASYATLKPCKGHVNYLSHLLGPWCMGVSERPPWFVARRPDHHPLRLKSVTVSAEANRAQILNGLPGKIPAQRRSDSFLGSLAKSVFQ